MDTMSTYTVLAVALTTYSSLSALSSSSASPSNTLRLALALTAPAMFSSRAVNTPESSCFTSDIFNVDLA